ncbi:MAG: hypothetical protein JJE30_14430 [Desulfuromonadales bacterium]|nr:hypothetical protein [Desulfuromonadales bacterium]
MTNFIACSLKQIAVIGGSVAAWTNCSPGLAAWVIPPGMPAVPAWPAQPAA